MHLEKLLSKWGSKAGSMGSIGELSEKHKIGPAPRLTESAVLGVGWARSLPGDSGTWWRCGSPG